MAESEAEKILVRAANGDLWLIRKGEIPDKKHSYEDAPPKDQSWWTSSTTRQGASRSFRVSEPRCEGPNRRSGSRRTALKNVATGPSLFGSGF